MSAIDIKGLKISACHGVLESEKQTPQLFVFDVAIDCDTARAARLDDVEATVNYAEVCALVNSYCKDNSFNLIEKLARGTAMLIANKYSVISAVEVTVHKPQAPVGLPFGDVSVTARVERNKVILSLGSSEGDREAILKEAIDKLCAVEGMQLLRLSDFITSQPYGGIAKNEFVNCAASFSCLLSPRELMDEMHRIEGELGRVRKERWGDRTADIDIIFFGNKVIAEEGLCVPHPDYHSRAFVLEPVKAIEPAFVCPVLHKRMLDL